MTWTQKKYNFGKWAFSGPYRVGSVKFVDGKISPHWVGTMFIEYLSQFRVETITIKDSDYLYNKKMAYFGPFMAGTIQMAYLNPFGEVMSECNFSDILG